MHACMQITWPHWPELKKEKWAEGCVVKDRCEPAYISQVLQAVCAAQRAAAGGDGGAGPAGADEGEVAARAHENTMRMFFAE